MHFTDYIRDGKVIKGQKDFQKAKALVKMSKDSIDFLATMKISDQSVTMICVNYYEALRQILEAMSLQEGYKVLSHEAYTSYLKEKGEVSLAEKFDRLRKLRNGANYYGKPIPKEVTESAKTDVISMVGVLKKKYIQDDS